MFSRVSRNTVRQAPVLASAQSTVQTAAAASAASAVHNFSTSSSVSKQYKHFKVENQSQVAVIRMNHDGGKMNMVSTSLMTEFDGLLSDLNNDASVKAMVVVSEQDNFIVGANINEFVECKTAEEMSALAKGGQGVMQRMEDSKKPIVAALKGQSLGGGAEFALACHYRIAADDGKAVIAFPEVMLGLLPASGGCQRLPKLMGARNALPYLLTGKKLSAKKALDAGVINALAKPENLEAEAVAAARSLIESGVSEKHPVLTRPLDWALEFTSVGRNFLFGQAKSAALRQSRGHYPALPEIIDAVKYGVSGKDGYAKEAEAFGRLGMTSVSRNLVNIFFAQTALKKNRFGNPERSYNQLAVVGAGLMGAGIADVSVNNKFDVLLMDSTKEGLDRGVKQIKGNLDKRVDRGAKTPADRDAVMARLDAITTEGNMEKFGKVDMVIEAVFEDLALKHKVIQNLEKYLPEHAVLATNTSALPIAQVAEGSSRPENVVGMHYFSPVEKMPLLEVIATDKTSNEAKAAAVDVGIKQGKTVIVVGDGPGFYTSRILAPMMMEGAALMLEGIEPKELDKRLQSFGFPVGPVTLMDEVGIDVAQHITPGLQKAFGARMEGNDALIQDMVAQGNLGRKSKKGFYLYQPPKPLLSGNLAPLNPIVTPVAKAVGMGPKRSKPVNPEALKLIAQHYTPSHGLFSLTVEESVNRMVSRFVNEAVFCLQDGILENATDGDVGAIFGLGFPPFLGGPFRYLDAYGAENYVNMMNRLADKYGERFVPAPLLVDMAKSGKKFHSK